MTNDDLDAKLRERLHGAALPAAPASLRRVVAELPAPIPKQRRGRGMLLLAAAALVLVVVAVSGLLAGALPRRLATVTSPPSGPTMSASASASASPIATAVGPSMPAGYVAFEAPGIRFAHPADWLPSTAFETYPGVLGIRFVGTFARGMTLCPNTMGVEPAPSKPAGCTNAAGAPGTLRVDVIEFLRQLPGSEPLGVPTTYNGYSAWVRDDDGGDPATLHRFVAGPDDSLYWFSASTSRDQADAASAELDATLQTLDLSSWAAPPTVVDGRIHVDTGRGFSFDYPDGWVVYYPQDDSASSGGVVTVASRAVEPCTSAECQRFTTPPGTIAIEFRYLRLSIGMDWSQATATIDGHPAFVQQWGSEMVTGADEGHLWTVRLTDDFNGFGIYASLRGPGLEEQRRLMTEIVNSVTIDQARPASP
jgi:hypothetical protein